METKHYNEALDFGSSIKIHLEKRISLPEFVDMSRVSVPRNARVVFSRMKANFEMMTGNYMIVLGMFLVFYVFWKPLFILPLALWACVLYLLTQESGTAIFVRGNSIPKAWVYIGAGVLSAVFLLFRSDTIISLFALLGVAAVMISAHMVFYTPLDSSAEIP
jgi:PRA1 family protein